MTALIIANFHVWVPGVDGEKRISYQRGMIVDQADMPAGQTIEQWIEKGLAAEAKPATPVDPA